MNVLFIQSSIIPQFGIMYLSAVLKSKGHKTKLVREQDAFNAINKFHPGLIAISLTTGEHKNLLKVAQDIKKEYSIPIIAGGPHATFFPELIENSYIDFIGIGECDYALLELVEAIEKRKDTTKIANIWAKKGKKIIKNMPANLIADLDKLPFPDREIYYDDYDFLRYLNLKNFMSGRGCPYNCSFCFNHAMQKLYSGKGNYIRKRTPENLIAEIMNVREKYPVNYITFTDDTFIIDRIWLKHFCKLYKQRIAIPFICNIRANLITEEIVRCLKDAGCFAVSMGIETGNENIRNSLLRKGITDSQILLSGKLIKKYKLKLKTYNMLGYPQETLEDAFNTLRLNAKLNPDQASFAIIQPYPGTEFCRDAIEKGYLSKDYSADDVPDTLRASSPLKYKNKKEIENLLSFAFVCIKFPFLIPLVKILIKLPPNALYRTLSKAVYGYYMSRFYNLNIGETIKYAIQSGYKFA